MAKIYHIALGHGSVKDEATEIGCADSMHNCLNIIRKHVDKARQAMRARWNEVFDLPWPGDKEHVDLTFKSDGKITFVVAGESDHYEIHW